MARITHLKAGDKIAVEGNSRQRAWDGPIVEYDILVIDRVAPTQVVCGQRRFNRSSGRVVGAGYCLAQEATPELLEQHEAQKQAKARFIKARGITDLLDCEARRNLLSEAEQTQLIELFGHKLENAK